MTTSLSFFDELAFLAGLAGSELLVSADDPSKELSDSLDEEPRLSKKVTSLANTSTLLRFWPSCSQLRLCKRPCTRLRLPLFRYCETRSASGPQATTST